MPRYRMFSFVFVSLLVGCAASPSPAPQTAVVTPPAPAPEPATPLETEVSGATPAARTTEPSAATPAQDDMATTMITTCPMRVEGTTVRAEQATGGIAIVFTTFAGSVDDLRQRVRRWADMHNQHMASASGSPPGGMHGSHSGMGGAMHGAAMHGGMMLVHLPSTASVSDVPNGARIVLMPQKAADLAALRQRVTEHADSMRSSGSCPMMSSTGSPPAGQAPRSEPSEPVRQP